MSTEKKKKLKRRQRRHKKMHKLKALLAASKDHQEREKIIAKLKRIDPLMVIEE